MKLIKMTRGRKLTPEDIDEIRRLKKEGKTVEEIHDLKRFSHTTIVQYTKDLQSQQSPSSRSFTSPPESSERPCQHQHLSPRKKVALPPPSDLPLFHQTYPYSEPYQDPNQQTMTWMDSSSTTQDQNPIIEEMNKKKNQEFQRDIERMDRAIEEYKSMGKEVDEMKISLAENTIQKQKQQEEQQRQREEAELRTRLEEIKKNYNSKINAIRLQSKDKYHTSVQKEAQSPSIMNPVSQEEPQTNDTEPIKAIPNQEKIQASAEKKFHPTYQPNVPTWDSPSQNTVGVNNKHTSRSYSESPKKISPIDTIQNDVTVSNEDTNKNFDYTGIIILHTIASFLQRFSRER